MVLWAFLYDGLFELEVVTNGEHEGKPVVVTGDDIGVIIVKTYRRRDAPVLIVLVSVSEICVDKIVLALF